MDATLSQRYLLAVARSVPEQQRGDVERELAALMADQIDDRVAAGEDPAFAERSVIEALGDPDALAAGYVDRPLHLIGPRYFLEWKRLLVLLLWIVPPFAAAASALAQVLAGADVGGIIGQTVVVTMGAILHVGFWVTLVFAILERTGAGPGSKAIIEWTPDRLPMPRETGARLSDLIASLVFVVLLAGGILWDLGIGFVPTSDGLVSAINGTMWPLVIGLLFVVMAAEVALAVWVYLQGRWTVAAAVVNTVLALTAAGILFYNLGELINPAAFEAAIAAGASDDLMFVLRAVTGFFIAGIAIWDITDGFLKARRAR